MSKPHRATQTPQKAIPSPTHIDPAKLGRALDAVELLSAEILAVGALFSVIAENTTAYTVVHPVAKAGQKVSANLTDNVLDVVMMLGELLNRETVADQVPA